MSAVGHVSGSKGQQLKGKQGTAARSIFVGCRSHSLWPMSAMHTCTTGTCTAGVAVGTLVGVPVQKLTGHELAP